MFRRPCTPYAMWRKALHALLIASLAIPGAPALAQGATGQGAGTGQAPRYEDLIRSRINGGAPSSNSASTNSAGTGLQTQTIPSVSSPTIVSPPDLKNLPLLQPNAPVQSGDGTAQSPTQPSTQQQQPQQTSEFQDFIAQSVGRQLPIYGQDLFIRVPTTFAPVDQVPVPANYVIGPGDEIIVRAWGQVDVDYRVMVDRNGQINVPKIGTLNIAGIRNDQLESFLKSAIGRIYRNFDLSASLGQLRSIQVYVVGFANRPGVYTVSSLSTMVNTLFASGGPSVRGSMRKIQLKRGAQVVTEFDFYDLLLRGDKSNDAKLQPQDVIYIPAVGPLAAVAGSVNQPAIYELKNDTTLEELLSYAGGLTPTALGAKASIERIRNRQARNVEEFGLNKEGFARKMQDGDLVQIQSLSPRFENAVTLRGNVAYPARFAWREGLRVKDLIPDRESLIVPEYWLKRNQATRIDVGSDRALRTEVKRGLPEVNWDYAVVERLNLDQVTTALIPINLGKAVLENDPSANILLRPGDVITIFSKDDIQVPVEKQTKYVRLEGELRYPGVYQLFPGETLRELLRRVGGLSNNAYLYGAEFTRESTRALQQKRLDEALDRLAQEVERAAATAASAAVNKDGAEAIKLQSEGQRRLLERLRGAKATGRIVLNVAPEAAQPDDLPEITLEDGDRLVVPARPSTVAVLGSVYNQNAFLYQATNVVSDYISQAGGPTRDADTAHTYIVRADGVVTGGTARTFFFSNGVEGKSLMPGDAVVVPEDLERFRFTKELKDWSQILYQFALGVVGLKVLKNL